MIHYGRFIAKNRVAVLIAAVLLLLPSLYGMAKTKINYDVLTYLPGELDSMKGQDILDSVFSDAATSMLIIEGDMQSSDVQKIKKQVEGIDGVESAIWVDDIADITIPKEILPDSVKNIFYSKNSTLMIIKYKDIGSSERTMNAIASIKKCLNKQCFLSGVSAILKDTKDLADRETPFYVMIAVACSVVVLLLTMNSILIPFIFLIGMGFAIMYNMGTNIIFGQISYITKALAAVLQLAVTTDYSIFLLHRYEEEKQKNDDRKEAMAKAISSTIASITGSSLTTVAGFMALCFMQLTLGKDIGFVMAKGVLLGLVSVVTVLPAMILVFDKPIHRFTHRSILPTFEKTARVVTNKYAVFIAIFILAFIPAIFGQSHIKVYYNLDESLPKDMASVVATNKLKDEFNMLTTHFILVRDDLPPYKVKEMSDRIGKVDGIEKVLSYEKVMGPGLPESFIPEKLRNVFKKGGYELFLANSRYKAARDSENKQIDEIIKIVKSYDSSGMVAGEGPLTKDLVEIADKDFKTVSFISILAIFIIIMLVFQSLSVPVILVMSIELAIFINMAIPYYTNTTIPFIASIVIGCIQLGATVDYSILMTTRYREELRNGHDKHSAMEISVKGCARSIMTSALAFFAATAGVGLISDMAIIKSLCNMLARGALISMVIIIFILPSILLALDKFVEATSRNWKRPLAAEKDDIVLIEKIQQ